MKTKKLTISILAIALMLSIAAPSPVQAATTPSLGLAATFGVLANTFNYNGGLTAITGDLGMSAGFPGGGASLTVSGATQTNNAAWTAAGIDQNNTLSAGLAPQTCTFTFANGAVDLATDTTHGQIGVYAPGVYCINGAASVGTAGIYLNGAGTYIFRIVGALNTANNSNIYSAGASSCDVFWTPTQATTLGANTSFIGNVIDAAGITVGSTTSWIGRALAYGGTVTMDTDTITSTCTTGTAVAPALPSQGRGTINVVKTVINDNGGTKTVADFPLFINGSLVVSGATNTYNAPGLVFTVTETNNTNYTRTFSGDCDVNGQLNLIPGQNKFCIVTNNDIGAPVAVVPPLIDLVKTAYPLSLPAGPGTVVYTYTLRNIGTVPATNITIVGDTCSPIILASGDTNSNARLDLNETWINTCTQVLSSTHTNTAVATGWANGISATDIASATVVVGAPVVPPLIHVVKRPNLFTIPVGGAVTYNYTVTNPGTAPLSDVSITDDKCTGLPNRVIGHPGDLNKNNLLESNETWSFTCKSRLYTTTTNIGTARGYANGLMATDLALATVVVYIPKLPTTGFPTKETDTMIVVASIVIVLLAFYARRKKEIV
ncbi:MAG: ice-binding family protein [Candidatus Paceibacterota bacterium]|jgi:hypothetical protein